MHLRRVLLLFAIVLGFSAVAASLAPPSDDDSGETTTAEEAPAPAPPAGDPPPAAGTPEELRFVTGSEEPERHTIEAGERAVVTVAVEDAGQVAIQGLGLIQAAEPGTPARFDVLPSRPGRYEVTFRPVEGEPERIGIIEVDAA
ncbi:MAG: hypothetical protein WD844_14270 [Thermoleophilaceae bacterium]